MQLLQWIVPLLLGAVGLTVLARRVGAPYPAFLALGGVAVALMPHGPRLALEPDLALVLFVAPILVDTAYDASPRDLRANWLPITLLVLAAVAMTTLAVAVAARLMRPDLPWPAAIALGAIVAPPDATAATAILRQVRLPFRISTIIEGESLLNDASALFIYRLAVSTVAVGSLHPGFLVASFVLVVPLSIASGCGLAWVVPRILGPIDDAPSAVIIQFGTTFAIWMLAEKLQLSAVLVLVAYAVTISLRQNDRYSARLRLPTFAVWEAVTFSLNVLVFVLIGLQLRPILDGMKQDALLSSIGFAVAILLVCIVARLTWVAGLQGLRLRALERRQRRHRSESEVASPRRGTFKGSVVIAWCGMRGIVTLAAAFALPDGFPHRDLMLLTAFTVVLGTLVVQGLTLRPLLRWADLEDDDPVGREIGFARTEVHRAALAVLEGEEGKPAKLLRIEYERIIAQARESNSGASVQTDHDELRLRTIAAGRQRLFELRAQGDIGNGAFQIIEFELDRAEMHATAV